MKKLITIPFFFCCVLLTNAQLSIQLQPQREGLHLSSNTGLSFSGTFSISEINFDHARTPVGVFSVLSVPEFTFRYNDGNPSIPVYSRLVEIPGDVNVNIQIKSFTTQVIQLSDYGIYERIVPAQPSYSKSTDPKDIEFKYNEAAYQVNDFTEGPLVNIEYQSMARGVGIAQMIIDPVRYNPVTNQLLIYNNVEFEVEYKTNDYAFYLSEKERVYSGLFSSFYHKLPNFIPPANKDLITQYPIKYVIVSDPMFRDSLQQFVKWKTQKGFKVVEAYTDNPSVGNTTTSIKSFLQGLYNAGTPSDPAPSFILFVGDVAQIPSFAGTTGTHPSDLYYAEYTGGTDYIPELYYGRFSATNIAQLMPQIYKTLQYEKFTLPSTSFMDTVVMVAGVDASWSPTHANGQINYGTNNYFNATHGIFSHTYLYPTSNESWVDADVRAKVGAGAGFSNYTAHCNSNGWGDPNFTTAHIPAMPANNKFGTMVGNCCLSNKFNDAECFGEAMLRVSNKGTVGYLGGSNNTYWDEDYFWGVGYTTSITANPTYAGTGLGSYDKLFHDHGEPYADWFVTNGQINYGGNTAVQASTSSRKKYYWEIYHLMGDPSLMTYLWNPQPLSMNYNNTIMVGDQSLVVSCEPYTLVALSQNDVLIDSKFSGPNNTVTLNFPGFTTTGTALIVGTKQNRRPHIQNITIDEISVPVDAQVYDIGNLLDAYTCVNVHIQPTVVLRNKGLNNLIQATINYSWNGGAVQSFMWTGNLASLDTAHIILPQYLITTGNHNLLVYSTNPNGVIDGNTSNDTLSKSLTAQNLPVTADFTVDNTMLCNLPATVQFINTSQNALSYLWNFGDGNTSTAINPSHVYTINGLFSVSLTADAGICGSDVKVYSNMIQIGNVPPAANFSASNLTPVVGNTITFNDLSDCTPTSWSWSFNPAAPVTFMNGTNSNSQHPQVSFSQTGIYSVTLTATNTSGSDVEEKTNYINVINCIYCTSSFSNLTDEWISNVTFNTINNNSGSTSYSDFSGISTNLVPGSSYNVSVTVTVNGSYTEHCTIYIDWNQDCVFGTGESYYLGSVFGTGTLTGTIAVPLNALFGPTRMRVSMRYSTQPTGCDVTTFGEAEDYTVNVQSATGCLPPTGLIAHSITQTGATLSWTPNGTATNWNLEWGPNGFSQGTGTTTMISNNPATTLSGLSDNTTYQFYVQSDCGNNDVSNWVGPVSFSTLCGLITSFPFAESFDQTTFAPPCWTNIKTAGTSAGIWDRQTSGTYPSTTPQSGAGMARFNSFSYSSGTQGILVTPALQLSHDQYEISFWMYRDNGYLTNADLVNVLYNTSNNMSGATLLGTINRSSSLTPVVAANGWYQYTFQAPSGVSGISFIIFEGSSAYGNNIFIDDVRITELIPPCDAPSQLSASATSGTSAVVDWQENGSATSWDIEYGNEGFISSGIPDLTVTSHPHTISGLNAGTNYDVYVRSVCSMNSFSQWTGPHTFSTQTRTLNLSVFLEGLYESPGMMSQARHATGSQYSVGIADAITVELYDQINTNLIHYQNTNVMLNTDGSATVSDIPAALSGEYYIVIKHRNSIETWSSLPVAFNGAGDVSCSFTTAATQAFGNNLKAMTGGYYAIFSGDVNTDGVVDGSDMSMIDNAATDFLSGYLPEDINGDGIVDGSDMMITVNNSTLFIHTIKP
jgi:PKD repeat protein